MDVRVRALFATVTVLVAVPSFALAQSGTVPPGNSEVDQYAETAPGATGNEPGNPDRNPGDVLSPSQQDDLKDLGDDGTAAAALAAATAPDDASAGPGAGGADGGSSPATSGAAGGSGATASAAADEAAEPLAAPGEDGMGSALWIIAAVAALAALAYAATRRRLDPAR